MKKRRNNIIEKIKNRIKPETKISVDLSIDIADQVRHLLKYGNNIKTQKKLAEILNKEESEISKWLSGLHNLTIDSIAKLTAALDHDIILTDLKARAKYERVIIIYNTQIIFVSDATEVSDSHNYELTDDKDNFLLDKGGNLFFSTEKNINNIGGTFNMTNKSNFEA